MFLEKIKPKLIVIYIGAPKKATCAEIENLFFYR